MLERILKHPAGRFPRCRKCGTEPRHVVSRGRSTRDPIVILHPAPAVRHMLECGCGARTARHALLVSAEFEWSMTLAQPALPAPRRRRAAA